MDIKEEIRQILASVIAAKQQALAPLSKMCDDLSAEGSDYDTAKVFVQEVARNEDTLGRGDAKELISPVAVKHKIWVDLGYYGNGEFVIVDEDGASDYGVEIGGWVSSSESC